MRLIRIFPCFKAINRGINFVYTVIEGREIETRILSMAEFFAVIYNLNQKHYSHMRFGDVDVFKEEFRVPFNNRTTKTERYTYDTLLQLHERDQW